MRPAFSLSKKSQSVFMSSAVGLYEGSTRLKKYLQNLGNPERSIARPLLLALLNDVKLRWMPSSEPISIKRSSSTRGGELEASWS
jgi:hypothetical protein